MTHARRGYALPLVFLLSLVVAFMLSLAIERNTAQVHNARRQLDGYRQHHVAKGLQEAISAWLTKQNARTITDAITEDGHAIDLILPDNSIVAVYMRDGQGTFLDPQAASSADYQNALGLRQRMELLCQDSGLDPDVFQRPLGPFAISVNSASPLVIQAVGEQLLGPDGASDLVNKILERRSQQGTLDRQAILGIGTEMELDTNTRNQLLSFFTASPEMWYVTIELYGGTGGRTMLARYGGLVPVRSANRTTTGAWEQPGVFLTWEELSVEYDESEGSEP